MILDKPNALDVKQFKIDKQHVMVVYINKTVCISKFKNTKHGCCILDLIIFNFTSAKCTCFLKMMLQVGQLIEKAEGASFRDTILVSGFARSNALMEVPLAIIQICIAFFLCVDEWDVNNKGKHLKISGINNEIVECTNPESKAGKNYQTVLGKLRVDTGKHHWKFKLCKVDLSKKAYWRIVIGIIKINEFNDDELNSLFETYLNFLGNAYGIIANAWGNSWRLHPEHPGNQLGFGSYGPCVGVAGDIIDMYLDLDNHALSFEINNENYGYVYNGYTAEDESDGKQYKIDKAEYKIGMSLSREGIAMELLLYEQMDEIPTNDEI